MAANGIRTLTNDADLSTHDLANDEESVRDVVAKICALTPDAADGVRIDAATIRTETMREAAEYSGVRCKLGATLGQARIPFALDFSFGDAASATVIELESVIGQPALSLRAYPLSLNVAEKIVTAMQRRSTNTRDRDFADLWVVSRRHRLDAHELRQNIGTVAEHREQPIITMAEALMDIPNRQRSYTAMVERMSYLSTPPTTWTELIEDVIAFVDPLLEETDDRSSRWDPEELHWIEGL